MDVSNYNLIIVESDLRAETISKYLLDEVDDWIVKSTGGQLFDLPKKQYGISFENQEISADWEFVSLKTKNTAEDIKQIARNAESVFIATNGNKDGEKIAKDLFVYLDQENIHRVIFKEITKKSITEELFGSIREINDDAVSAAKVIRFIDRDIGFSISGLLQKSLKEEAEKICDFEFPPLSVGRILNPALHLLCEVEKSISGFITENYYQVNITYINFGRSFKVYNEKKFREEDELYLNQFITTIQNSKHRVTGYKEKTRNASPPKPLDTKSLLKSSYYLLGLKPDETSKIAQKLFDCGYITYHETNSYIISTKSIQEIRSLILNLFGKEYLTLKPRDYKKKKKKDEENIELENEEAIRPTNFSIDYAPWNISQIDKELTKEDLELYSLIWTRSIASQMIDSTYDDSNIEITVADETFWARANNRISDGWERISEEVFPIKDESRMEAQWMRKIVKLPKVKEGEFLIPLDIDTSSHRTRAPQRYGVGRFIEVIYKQGIVTTNTISGLVDRLIQKKYCTYSDSGQTIKPTELGLLVDDWVEEYFPWLNSMENAKSLIDRAHFIETGNSKETADSIILEYHKLVKEGADNLGQSLEYFLASRPTAKQIELMKKISQEKNIVIGEELFRNKEKATLFLKKHVDSLIIGKCISCESGDVFESENYYKCNNKECNFIVTKKRIRDYFMRFKYEVEEHELNDMVTKMIAYDGYFKDELISSKGNSFKGTFVFVYNDEYGWNVGFKN